MRRRQTRSKKLVHKVLSESKVAMSQQDIQYRIGDKMDKVTIYRVLNRFLEDGEVHQIVGDDGKKYFALCSSCDHEKHQHDHFHFRCLDCGKVECLDDQILVSLPPSYKLKSINAILTGTCGLCVSKAL